jgi:hypothetical protein
VKDLTNFSTLVWEAPEGKHLWIQILIRSTDSQWQKQFFKEDTKAEIAYSKTIFLCCSSSRQLGHPSLAVFLNQYDNNSKVKRLNGRFFYP